MTEDKLALTFGALLHDIGKVVYRGSSAKGTHSKLGADSQFFNVDTTSELAFGPENLGLPEDEIIGRIYKTAIIFFFSSDSFSISNVIPFSLALIL